MVASFKPPFRNGLTVTFTGITTATPLASVTVTENTLVVAEVGVAEKTKLKSPVKMKPPLTVFGNCEAELGAVKVTGLAPLATQVSMVLAALKLTRE